MVQRFQSEEPLLWIMNDKGRYPTSCTISEFSESQTSQPHDLRPRLPDVRFWQPIDVDSSVVAIRAFSGPIL